MRSPLPPFALLLALGLAACDDSAQREAEIKARARAVAEENNRKVAAERRRERSDCAESRTAKQAQFQRLMTERKYRDAALSIRRCSEVLDDAELKTLVAKAETQSHLAEIGDPKVAPRDKVRAIEILIRDYPAEGKKYESLMPKLVAQAEAQDRANEAKQHAVEAKRRRSEGVHIGMTAKEVLASSWGRPESVNRTTYSWGTHEQWVYGGRNYLYFENGKLTAIQN